MGCVHSSLAVGPSVREAENAENAKKEPIGHAIVGSHAHQSIDTLGSSLESHVDVMHAATTKIEEPVPPPELHWKLSLGEIKHSHTLNRLDELKRVGLTILDVPKCRVCLISCTHLWISTRTGAFSPALAIDGAPWQGSFDHYYRDKRTDPFIMEDARLDPRCANHPGVIGRPNLRFYIGAPLLSRGHLIGLYYVADSQPRSVPSDEQISKIIGISEDALDALQQDMFTCLLENSNAEKIDKDTIELPVVWIDVSTAKWRVLGVNQPWETLTGVSYSDLKECQGLLEVMIASNERGLVLAVEHAKSNPGFSIPAILSPCAPNGVSLQYIFSIKPADEITPAVAAAAASISCGDDGNDVIANGNIWVAEVHARVQAAAYLTGDFAIDPSGVENHRLLPTADPSFGSLLPACEIFKTNNSTITSSASSIYSPVPGGGDMQHYQYHTHHNYHHALRHYGDASSGSGGGGRGRGSGGSSGGSSSSNYKPSSITTSINNKAAATPATASPVQSRYSYEMPTLQQPLLVSATAVLEVGSMQIPPRLTTLQIGPLLGKGSYGAVYWGTLQDVGVAIKVMQHAPGPEAEEQLWAAQYEAMVASDLEHANLVRTIDWCCHYEGLHLGGVMWIVQELCNKGSLAIGMKEGALRIEQGNVESAPDMVAVLEIAADVARAMKYLHSHELVHGDLSSNNVLFTSSEENNSSNTRGFRAKVADFGLSRALGGQDCSTKTVGTISHMPPELLIEGVMAKSGDVYSFGVMLWELYTGKRAWGGSTQAQVIFAITCKNAILLLPSDTPAGYAALATACMDHERSNRPMFDEIVEKLEELLSAEK